MIFRAEALAVRGLANTLTHSGNYEHLTAMPEKLNSFLKDDRTTETTFIGQNTL